MTEVSVQHMTTHPTAIPIAHPIASAKRCLSAQLTAHQAAVFSPDSYASSAGI